MLANIHITLARVNTDFVSVKVIFLSTDNEYSFQDIMYPMSFLYLWQRVRKVSWRSFLYLWQRMKSFIEISWVVTLWKRVYAFVSVSVSARAYVCVVCVCMYVFVCVWARNNIKITEIKGSKLVHVCICKCVLL